MAVIVVILICMIMNWLLMMMIKDRVDKQTE